eukprot:3717629-Rhodomonas_salina.1
MMMMMMMMMMMITWNIRLGVSNASIRARRGRDGRELPALVKLSVRSQVQARTAAVRAIAMRAQGPADCQCSKSGLHHRLHMVRATASYSAGTEDARTQPLTPV